MLLSTVCLRLKLGTLGVDLHICLWALAVGRPHAIRHKIVRFLQSCDADIAC